MSTTTTKEHPILFSGPMVKALLAGRKTQTRRAANIFWDTERYWGDYDCWTFRKGKKRFIGFSTENGGHHSLRPHCPYGLPGDRLWVRETWRTHERPDGLDGIVFAADEMFLPIENAVAAGDQWIAAHDNGNHGENWHSSIFMPRWASRITLEITNIRVQRVQEISPSDVWAEGLPRGIYRHAIKGFHPCDDGDEAQLPDGRVYPAVAAYAQLWDEINCERSGGALSWESNPWVWCVTFKKC